MFRCTEGVIIEILFTEICPRHLTKNFSFSFNGARLNTTCETTVSIPEDSDEQQEVIEVQILPQVTTLSLY